MFSDIIDPTLTVAPMNLYFPLGMWMCACCKYISLGLATIDRIRHTYSSHITGSITVLVTVGWLCDHIQNTAYAQLSITICQMAIYSSCTGVQVPIINEAIILLVLWWCRHLNKMPIWGQQSTQIYAAYLFGFERQSYPPVGLKHINILVHDFPSSTCLRPHFHQDV